MTKAKRRKDRDSTQDGQHPSVSRPTDLPASRRPMLFEVPFTAVAPRLINPAIGLASLLPSQDPDATYTIDVTLLDSPDHRLVRSGVLLAHRVQGGVGEWYLSADGWQPFLPAEQTEPMGASDLPQSFVDLVRPFRRIGALGPVAALTCERRGTVFLDGAGQALATVRDARVTVRRGGLTTARFREVSISPLEPGLDAAQREFLARALGGLGGVPVPGFPSLIDRLGAPGTGLSDYPEPRPLDRDDAFAGWLSNLIAVRMRELIHADLSIRQGATGYAPDMAEAGQRLRTELTGVGALLDRDWLVDIDADLDWLTGTPEGELAARLRTERYLSLLEQLVNAARAPKVDEAAMQPARQVLQGLVDDTLQRLGALAETVGVDASDGEWQAIIEAVDETLAVCAIAGHLVGKPAGRITKRLLPLRESLAGCLVGELADLRRRALAGEPAEAFALGRQYEQGIAVRNARRRAWLSAWDRQSQKLFA